MPRLLSPLLELPVSNLLGPVSLFFFKRTSVFVSIVVALSLSVGPAACPPVCLSICLKARLSACLFVACLLAQLLFSTVKVFYCSSSSSWHQDQVPSLPYYFGAYKCEHKYAYTYIHKVLTICICVNVAIDSDCVRMQLSVELCECCVNLNQFITIPSAVRIEKLFTLAVSRMSDKLYTLHVL